jgi:hypothetical protein
MKRITCLAALAVGLLAWALPAQAAFESFAGSVKSVSGSSITVERGTISGVFSVNPKTQLFVKGATAKTKEARAAGRPGLTVPEAVHVGDHVIIRYFEEANGMVAGEIRVVASLTIK